MLKLNKRLETVKGKLGAGKKIAVIAIAFYVVKGVIVTAVLVWLYLMNRG